MRVSLCPTTERYPCATISAQSGDLQSCEWDSRKACCKSAQRWKGLANHRPWKWHPHRRKRWISLAGNQRSSPQDTCCIWCRSASPNQARTDVARHIGWSIHNANASPAASVILRRHTTRQTSGYRAWPQSVKKRDESSTDWCKTSRIKRERHRASQR